MIDKCNWGLRKDTEALKVKSFLFVLSGNQIVFLNKKFLEILPFDKRNQFEIFVKKKFKNIS